MNDNTPKESYAHIKDVPTELLAHNFVGTLILCKGNLNQYKALTEMLIRGLRGEPDPPKEDA